jgi:hypothetical protein
MSNELASFHAFVEQQILSGRNDMSLDEALEIWHDQHPDPASEDATQEIQEALDDMAAGDHGVPFEEFDREFRRRNNIS